MTTPEYSLIIDAHEHKLIGYLKDSGCEVPFKTTNLDIGDVIIMLQDNPVVVFERKALPDLVSSINGERYRNQKIRLKTLPCIVIYLIEGLPGDSWEVNAALDKIYGSWAGIILRDKMNVLRSFDVEESAKLILKFYKRAQEFNLGVGSAGGEGPSESGTSSLDYLKTIKLQKKANITPNNILILQLSQIPGISVNMADKIHALYPTLQKLIEYYESLEESSRAMALKDISVGARKLGKSASEKIYKYLYGIGE